MARAAKCSGHAFICPRQHVTARAKVKKQTKKGLMNTFIFIQHIRISTTEESTSNSRCEKLYLQVPMVPPMSTGCPVN